MNKNNKYMPILYTIMMFLFIILSYIFIYAGVNTKSKEYIKYQENSNVEYRVYLKDNDIYDKEYLNMGDKYISELVDYINFDINYKNLFEKDINGFYTYNVDVTLVAYEEDINDSLWEKEYKIIDDTVMVLDKNNINEINVSDKVMIDYDTYKKEIDNFIDEYGIDVSGYLSLKFNINTMLNFSNVDKDIEDSRSIEIIIPIVDGTFKINILNEYDDINNYYDFSNKKVVNYLFLIFGMLSGVVAVILFILVLIEIRLISSVQSKYRKNLRKILNEHDDKIVNVKKFYNKKKYNLIYVDSFSELMDVYNKVGNPISYREVKKNYESIFLIIDDDNAWIYRMIASNYK